MDICAEYRAVERGDRERQAKNKADAWRSLPPLSIA